MKKFLPKLKKHFDKHNMDSVLYALKWFFVIFVERVSCLFYLFIAGRYYVFVDVTHEHADQ